MRAQARHLQIIRVASKLFAARGYAGTSIRDIAATIGVNVATIYVHFKNKRRLYEAVCTNVFSQRREPRLRLLAGTADDCGKLYRFVLSLAGDFLSDRLYFMLMHREMIDQSRRGLTKLSRTVFHVALEETGSVLDRISPRKDGYRRMFVCLSLVFGLVSNLRFGHGLRASIRAMSKPGMIAVTALSQVAPDVDWAAVSQRSAA